MPGGDGTGPSGRGSMTGWGRGICGESGRRGPALGRGGRGGAWGWRNRFRATGAYGWMGSQLAPPADAPTEPTAHAELRWLEQRSAELEVEKQQITARLDEFDRKPTD